MSEQIGNGIITFAGETQLATAGLQQLRVILGTGTAPHTKSSTALHNEVARLDATVVTDTMPSGDTRTRVSAPWSEQGVSADLTEWGIINQSGTLLIVYSQATPFGSKGAATSFLFNHDFMLDEPGVAGLVSTGDNTWALPQSSTTLKGVIELATDAEADAGTDDTRAVTARHLQRWVRGGSQNAKFVGNDQTDVPGIELVSAGGRVLAQQIVNPAETEIWRQYRLAGGTLTWTFNARFDSAQGFWIKDDSSSAAVRFLFLLDGSFIIERDPGLTGFIDSAWVRGPSTTQLEARLRTGPNAEVIYGRNVGSISFPTSFWAHITFDQPLANSANAIPLACSEDPLVNVSAAMVDASTVRLAARDLFTSNAIELDTVEHVFNVRVSGRST